MDPGDQSRSHGAHHPRPEWSTCQRHVALGGTDGKSRWVSPIVNHQQLVVKDDSGESCLTRELVSGLRVDTEHSRFQHGSGFEVSFLFHAFRSDLKEHQSVRQNMEARLGRG